jgi:MFS family permease
VVATVTAIGAVLAMVVSARLGRALAGRFGYRATMALGILALGIADGILSVTTTRPAFVLAHVFAGAGLGTYLSLDLAVALALLPRGAAGRVLGYFNAARKVPQSLVPAIAPALLALGSGDLVGVDRSKNYFALLAFGSLLALLALVLTSLLVVPSRPRGDAPVAGARPLPAS